MTTMTVSRDLQKCWKPAISAEANLRQQVKRSGRSQNSFFRKDVCGLQYELRVVLEANLRQQVKRSGRSQNHRLQKGLPV